jgi:hypothetical protein
MESQLVSPGVPYKHFARHWFTVNVKCLEELLVSPTSATQHIRNHVWFYHEFTTSTSQYTLSWVAVKCLGELLVSPNFQ